MKSENATGNLLEFISECSILKKKHYKVDTSFSVRL